LVDDAFRNCGAQLLIQHRKVERYAPAAALTDFWTERHVEFRNLDLLLDHLAGTRNRHEFKLTAADRAEAGLWRNQHPGGDAARRRPLRLDHLDQRNVWRRSKEPIELARKRRHGLLRACPPARSRSTAIS